MVSIQKPIWAEGVFLSQQHFQAWDRYLGAEQKLRFASIATFAWGLRQLCLDEDALANAELRVKSLQAILPDGQLVHYEQNETQPLSLTLKAEPSVRLPIYLALPNNNDCNAISGYHSNYNVARFETEYKTISDNFDQNRQREVMFGRLNICLQQGEQDSNQYERLKIAEVVNSGDGQYELVKNFIPTCLHLHTSNYLQQLLTRLQEQIAVKVRILTERREQYRENTEYGHADLDHFLLLQNLSSAYPVLQHLRAHKDHHPEQLFLQMIELRGALTAFTDAMTLANIPKYQHDHLTQTFTQLEEQLFELLNLVMPERLMALKLRRESDTLYIADVIEHSLLDGSRFFIGVYHQADSTDWIEQFSRQVKIGAINAMDDILASALSGAKVTHIQRPPNKLPVKTGYEYFYVENSSRFWEAIKTERNCAIFVPYDFINAKIDLVSLQE